MKIRFALALLGVVGICQAQQNNSSGGVTWFGLQDFSSANTKPFQSGTLASIPATCAIGQIYYASDQNPAMAIRQCNASNTWSATLPKGWSINSTGDVSCSTGSGITCNMTLGGTVTAYQFTASGSSTVAGFNLPTQSDPASPAAGDIWFNSPNFKFYDGTNAYSISSTGQNTPGTSYIFQLAGFQIVSIGQTTAPNATDANYVNLLGAGTGKNVSVTAGSTGSGADTNVGLNLGSKGSGNVNVLVNGANGFVVSGGGTATSTTDNFVVLQPNGTNTPPTISAQCGGTSADASCGLKLAAVSPATGSGNGAAGLGAITVVAGNGQTTTGTTGQTAGNGAALNLTAGNGGNAPSGSTNGNGANIVLTPGSAGAGAGTAGVNGAVQVPSGFNLQLGGGVSQVGGTSTAGSYGVASVQAAPAALTAQSASITSTTLCSTASCPLGLYQVNYYLYDTTAGSAGTVTVTLGWSDTAAAHTFTSGTASLATLGAQVGGSITVYANGSNAITYLTTVSGAAGSPKYSLVMTVTRVGL
jgi:hypothetical protein